MDASATLNESHSIHVVHRRRVHGPPDRRHDSLRHSYRLVRCWSDWCSRKRQRRCFDAAHSSTQRVGCEGTQAYGDFGLDGKRRLTGLLGNRDSDSKNLARVHVFVDGQRIQSYAVDDELIDFDRRLPEADSLRLQSIVSNGRCGSAHESPLGNGAVR